MTYLTSRLISRLQEKKKAALGLVGFVFALIWNAILQSIHDHYGPLRLCRVTWKEFIIKKIGLWFQLEFEIREYNQANKSIKDYYSGFMSLWMEYTSLVYATVPTHANDAIQQIQTTQRDQLLINCIVSLKLLRGTLIPLLNQETRLVIYRSCHGRNNKINYRPNWWGLQ